MDGPVVVTRLAIAPVKGLAVVEVPSVRVGRVGVEEDRRFFLLDDAGKVVTLRQHAELAAVVPAWSPAEGRLELALPGGEVVGGDGSHLELGARVESEMYRRPRIGREVLGPYSDALSALAGERIRLVMHDEPGSGWDEAPVAIVSSASLDEVAHRGGLDGGADVRRFRMLVQVDGPDAHGEDAWIGSEVEIGGAQAADRGRARTPRSSRATPTRAPATETGCACWRTTGARTTSASGCSARCSPRARSRSATSCGAEPRARRQNGEVNRLPSGSPICLASEVNRLTLLLCVTATNVIVVAGGGRGIGRATALRQARAGDYVYVWDVDGDAAAAVAEEIVDLGGEAEPGIVDVADTVRVRRAIADARARSGRLDGLVHAAGVTRTLPLADIDEDEFDRVMRINLRGAFFMTKAAADAIGEDGGSIVLFSSCSGRLPRPLSAHYAASKAALINFTGSSALAYGPRVRVNAVCPGVIATEMTQQIARERRELHLDDHYPGLAETLALKRLGEPDDVAMVVEFLLGPLSRYVTGQAINVDGGMVFS